MIGEIDCREGILYAVEKDRYKNLQEGSEHELSLYLIHTDCLHIRNDINSEVICDRIKAVNVKEEVPLSCSSCPSYGELPSSGRIVRTMTP